jgi:hypothetical protein
MMVDRYSHDELVERLHRPGWRIAAENEGLREGTLSALAQESHARHARGEHPGLLSEVETEIELDMLQLQALWRHLGLPTA